MLFLRKGLVMATATYLKRAAWLIGMHISMLFLVLAYLGSMAAEKTKIMRRSPWTGTSRTGHSRPPPLSEAEIRKRAACSESSADGRTADPAISALHIPAVSAP